MEKIENLVSLAKDLNWEKVFYARDIMNTLGYFKWERFNWAIQRTISSSDEDLTEHIIHIVNKNTGWRPREDYIITFYWLKKVLEKCYDKKPEIKRASTFVNNNLTSNPITSTKSKFKTKKILKQKFLLIKENIDLFYVSLILLILLSTAILYFFSSYTNYFVNNNPSNQLDVVVSSWSVKVEEVIDKEIEIQTQEIQELEQKVQIHNFVNKLNDYISENPNPELYFKSNDLNIRSDFWFTLTWTNLIESYFIFGNKSRFRESCSLLSKNLCLSASKSNLSSFSNFWNKTLNWYENIEVKYSWEKNSSNEDVYCVKYKYKLKNDLSDNYITEIFNYSLSTIDWIDQINQRYCEKVTKWDRNLKCPYKLQNYYCEKIFEN